MKDAPVLKEIREEASKKNLPWALGDFSFY